MTVRMKALIILSVFAGLGLGNAVIGRADAKADLKPRELKSAELKATEMKVEITSFARVESVDHQVILKLGEVCGKVTGGTAGAFIPVLVRPDYDSSNPANYMTYTAPDGTFCHVVMSLYGTVEVSLPTVAKSAKSIARARATQILPQ